MEWDGSPGHYEVWYLTLTDPASGVGAWIRLTMVAPDEGAATCSLWLAAMDPRARQVVARKATYPIDRLRAAAEPFSLTVAGAHLDAASTRGAFDDVAWDLRWTPGRAYHPVHPLLRRARIAKTVLELPQGDVEIDGTITLPGGRELRVDGARGAQAHLFGSKHARRWTWARCGAFTGDDGEPVPDTFLDGVSVYVPRLGREVGPSTPVVGRLLGEDFASTSPARVLGNRSTFTLTTWRFEARDGRRRVVGEVDAARDLLCGVTYHDPDGDLAYCYNSEVATMRLAVYDRTGRGTTAWTLRRRLVGDGTAHFEYAQREPVPALPLHV